MKRNELKRILSITVVTIMCTAVTACGQATASSISEPDTVVAQENTTEEDATASDMNNDENQNGETTDGASEEKPEGEAPDGEPGKKPEGEAPEGAPGEKPEGEAPDGAPGEKPEGEAPGNPPEGGGGFGGGSSSADIDYQGAVEITSSETQDSGNYTSTTADESALLISTSEDVTISDATVTKTGDSDGGDNCNFYGLNAAVLVKDGSTTNITGANITSDADGANGVFSYGGNGGKNGAEGDGTTVIISDSTITTTGDGSGGIMTTGGGVTKASNLTIETSGRSSAAIRTDRGGGTVTVDGGTYTTNGLGSPSIYSTADITVSDATLVSNLSEGVCIEGINSITLNDCDMTANNTDTNGNATFYDTIMIYQSMSGDADSGTSTFTMNGGTLTSKNGHVFHVTNTTAVINLNGVKIVNEDSDNILLSVCADGWNGDTNNATVNTSAQTLEGTILVGSDSELILNLTDGSSFEGSIDGNITNAKDETVSTEVGTVSVSIDESSTWTLTADTYITSFEGDISSVVTNGYTLYIDGVALN